MLWFIFILSRYLLLYPIYLFSILNSLALRGLELYLLQTPEHLHKSLTVFYTVVRLVGPLKVEVCPGEACIIWSLGWLSSFHKQHKLPSSPCPTLPCWAPEIPHAHGSWNMLPLLVLTSFDHVDSSNDNNSFSIGLFNKLLFILHQVARQIRQVSQKSASTQVGRGDRKGSYNWLFHGSWAWAVWTARAWWPVGGLPLIPGGWLLAWPWAVTEPMVLMEPMIWKSGSLLYVANHWL